MALKGRIHSLESFGTVDGPGTRFVVFFQGCPMRCKYCHNPDTWPLDGGTEMTVEEIIERYERNRSFYENKGGLTTTGGEPMMQLDFLIELYEECKKRGIHTCLDTSGIAYNSKSPENVSKVERLLESTDLVMLDIKHIDPDKHKELTKQPNEEILKFAQLVSDKGVDLWIRHVIVPGVTDDDEYLEKLGYFIGGLKTLKALDALPYHTMGVVKYEQLGIDYPLKGIKDMPQDKLLEKKQHILDGIKKRRQN
ncbi:MAG: pyruvate formate lyase-activating protein [Lachnospiraceae bacterium]|nr:pyruvate formate lyase-activating protein [Lachnospiraceae bacterium]